MKASLTLHPSGTAAASKPQQQEQPAAPKKRGRKPKNAEANAEAAAQEPAAAQPAEQKPQEAPDRDLSPLPDEWFDEMPAITNAGQIKVWCLASAPGYRPITMWAATLTGSTPFSGVEPWQPAPLTRMMKRSKEAMTGPGQMMKVPAGMFLSMMVLHILM